MHEQIDRSELVRLRMIERKLSILLRGGRNWAAVKRYACLRDLYDLTGPEPRSPGYLVGAEACAITFAELEAVFAGEELPDDRHDVSG